MLNQPSLPDHTLTDDIAMRLTQAGDEPAFELLYQRYGKPLNRYISSMVRSEMDPEAVAQDLVQEVFLRVWTRASQWSGQGSVKSWLYRIATNLALNHLRTLRRRPTRPLAGEEVIQWNEWSGEEDTWTPGWLVDTAALGPDAFMEQSEDYARLYRAIRRLPEEKREVFRMVHEMEMSIRDTADRLGIPEGTVKSRLHYAEKRVGQTWNELDPDV